MEEKSAEPTTATSVPASPDGRPPAWLRQAAVWVGVAIGVVVLVVLGVALLPGWWAATVGGWVRGVEDRGAVLGLVLGVVFTLLPVATGLLAIRSGLSPRTRLVLVVAALLLLLPNVLTIAVALGRTDARSVLAIEAPSFRGATAAGIGITVGLIVAAFTIRWWTRRTRRSVQQAREQAVVLGRERAAERADAERGNDSGVVEPGGATPAPPREHDPDANAQPSPDLVVDPGMSLTDPDRPAPTVADPRRD